MKKLYGLLAYPAGHSLSPVVHNAGFEAFGIDAEYVLFETKPEELDEFMKRVRVEPVAGFAVSLPFKEVVMRYLDEIDEDAKKIGAVNTVVNKAGKLFGYNTDFIGAIDSLKNVFGVLDGKTFVLLGAGGACRAIAYGLLLENAQVVIQNRDISKAEKIKKDMSKFFDSDIKIVNWEEPCFGDILINTTSIWLMDCTFTPENLPYFCHAEYLNNFFGVMDISYGERI
jgi:shikimate dehydrogenase